MWKKNKSSGRYTTKPVKLDIPERDSGTVSFSNISEDGFWVFDIANYLPDTLKMLTDDVDSNYYVGPWDLQLNESTDLTLAYYSSGDPQFGLAYDIFYQAEKIGKLEIAPRFYHPEFHEDHLENKTRDLIIYVEIEDATRFEYSHVESFLYVCYDCFAKFVDDNHKRTQNMVFVTRCLLKLIGIIGITKAKEQIWNIQTR